MHEHPATDQTHTRPSEQDVYDRIMEITRRDPIAGPTLKFLADEFPPSRPTLTRVTFSTGVNGWKL